MATADTGDDRRENPDALKPKASVTVTVTGKVPGRS